MNKSMLLFLFIPYYSYSGGILHYAGGVYEHHVNLDSASLNNTPGSIYDTGWNIGGSIPASDIYIDCTSVDIGTTSTIYSAQYNFPGSVSNGWVSFDDYWDISTQIYISGNLKKFVQVPFSDVSNLSNAIPLKCPSLGKHIPSSGSIGTGSEGKVSFKLKKKIVNGYSFISTSLLDIAGHTAPTGTIVSPDMSVPFARVILDSFMISLPEKCEINSGQTLDIDFGNVSSTKLDGKNYEKSSSLTVKCSSGDYSSGLSSVYADYIGDTTFSEQYFGSDNENIAIAVRDDNHQLIKPGDRKNLNLVNGETQFGLSLAPISDSKNMTEGEFNANIIIRLNLE